MRKKKELNPKERLILTVIIIIIIPIRLYLSSNICYSGVYYLTDKNTTVDIPSEIIINKDGSVFLDGNRSKFYEVSRGIGKTIKGNGRYYYIDKTGFHSISLKFYDETVSPIKIYKFTYEELKSEPYSSRDIVIPHDE